jgi:hypothetical protein
MDLKSSPRLNPGLPPTYPGPILDLPHNPRKDMPSSNILSKQSIKIAHNPPFDIIIKSDIRGK